MSIDEDAAAREWKEFWNQTHKGKSAEEISANYDGFFAGFYRGRDHERDKHTESETDNAAHRAAHKVLHAKGSSKAAKTKRGSALTQKD